MPQETNYEHFIRRDSLRLGRRASSATRLSKGSQQVMQKLEMGTGSN